MSLALLAQKSKTEEIEIRFLLKISNFLLLSLFFLPLFHRFIFGRHREREIDRRIWGEEGREEEALPSKEKARRRSSKESSGWRQLKTLKVKEKIMLTGKRLQLQVHENFPTIKEKTCKSEKEVDALLSEYGQYDGRDSYEQKAGESSDQLMNKIGAELQLELERLGLNMNTSTLEGRLTHLDENMSCNL